MGTRKTVTLFYAALLLGGAAHSWGYSNPIDGGSTETVEDFWNLPSDLHVGYNTSGNSLIVTNGGRVEASVVNVGVESTSSDNVVTVSGAGSILNVPEIYIGGSAAGAGGTDNRVEVQDGGTVVIESLKIYNNRHNQFNLNTGGHLIVNGDFHAYSGGFRSGVYGFFYNPGSTLEVGGELTGAGDFVDNQHTIILNGSNALWNKTGENLVLGRNTSGNTVIVTNGARVTASAELGVVIGYGSGGSGNQMVIADGALLESTGTFLGYSLLSSNNTMLVDDASVDLSKSLYVGDWGSNNHLTITNGGIMRAKNAQIGRPTSSAENSMMVTGEGSQLLIMDTLYVGNASPRNTLSIEDGGYVENRTGYVGYASGADKNTALVNGSGSQWIVADELYIGNEGLENKLVVKDGGYVESGTGYLGYHPRSFRNTVLVTGNGSIWNNRYDLYLSYYGVDNSLMVEDGGLVTVGRDIHNRNHSTISIDPGSRIVVSGNYYQDASSVLRFGVATNTAGAPLNALLSVGGTVEFEEDTTLQYHSNVGVLEFDRLYTNLIIEAEELIVDGKINANTFDLEAIRLDGSLVEVMLWEQDQDIYGLVGRRHLADSAGFAPDSQMALLSAEIDDLSLLGNSIAVGDINLLNGMSSAQQNAQLTQRYTQGTPTYRHRQGVLGGQKQVMAQSRAFQSASRSRGARPEGAAGPHKAEQGMRGWIRGYGSWANHDGTSSFSGFDQNVYGTVVGLDKVFGNVLLGAAGGYSRSDLTQDNLDSSDAKTGFGVLYSSFGNVDWFGDLNLSYGRSAIQTRSGTVLGGEGDFDADHFSVYLGGGKEIKSSEDDGVLFTPEAALLVGFYDQEGYQDGLMAIDSYNRGSVQSRIGAALAVEKQAGSVVLKPELRTYWLHEFNADPDQLGYSLGGGRYTFGVQAPDEDILEVGVGFSATFNNRLELVFDVDGQYSDLYESITVSGRAVYEF